MTREMVIGQLDKTVKKIQAVRASQVLFDDLWHHMCSDGRCTGDYV